MQANKWLRSAKWTLQPCAPASYSWDEKPWLSVDRISGLPDELLSQILCGLPTKDAVATCVLSRRWRRVYTWMTRLEFDYSPDASCFRCPHFIDKLTDFTGYVSNVLEACQSSVVPSFTLRMGNKIHGSGRYHECYQPCYPDLDPVRVNDWVRFPLTRAVRELDLQFLVKVPDKLPRALFSCETIEVLRLDMNLEMEVPTLFSLPCLRVLHLGSLDVADDGSISRLVSGCPALEDLVVKDCRCLSKAISFSAPSLRRLAIDLRFEEGFKRDSVALDAPNLRCLEYGDNLSLGYSVRRPDALEKAFINTEQPCGDPEVNFQSMLGLLRPLANIQHLSLGGFCIWVLEDGISKDKLPVFDNLKHLALHFYGFTQWHQILLELLNCSPRLESLDFPEGISDGDSKLDSEYDRLAAESEYQYWSTATEAVVPSCVRFHMKHIVIDRFLGVERELELVKFFLKNASVLEGLAISCRVSADVTSVKSAVRNLPKGSMNCLMKV